MLHMAFCMRLGCGNFVLTRLCFRLVSTLFDATRRFFIYTVVVGVDGSLQTLLDISGHEIYSAIFTSLREVSLTLTIIIAALVADVELKDVGFMILANVIVFFILNVTYIAYMGFWSKYYSGMIFSFALAVCDIEKELCIFHPIPCISWRL
jgi:hypothetical protein